MKKSLATMTWVSVTVAGRGDSRSNHHDLRRRARWREVASYATGRPTIDSDYRVPGARAEGISSAGYDRVSVVSADIFNARYPVPSGAAPSKLVESVGRSVLDERYPARDALGGAARDRAGADREDELGRGNANDASSGDDLSHGAGRVHEPRRRERRAGELGLGAIERRCNQRSQSTDGWRPTVPERSAEDIEPMGNDNDDGRRVSPLGGQHAAQVTTLAKLQLWACGGGGCGSCWPTTILW